MTTDDTAPMTDRHLSELKAWRAQGLPVNGWFSPADFDGLMNRLDASEAVCKKAMDVCESGGELPRIIGLAQRLVPWFRVRRQPMPGDPYAQERHEEQIARDETALEEKAAFVRVEQLQKQNETMKAQLQGLMLNIEQFRAQEAKLRADRDYYKGELTKAMEKIDRLRDNYESRLMAVRDQSTGQHNADVARGAAVDQLLKERANLAYVAQDLRDVLTHVAFQVETVLKRTEGLDLTIERNGTPRVERTVVSEAEAIWLAKKWWEQFPAFQAWVKEKENE